jgi:hypothetical protein
MAETKEEKLARLKEEREAKLQEMAAARLNTRAAAVESEAAKYYGVTASPVTVGATAAERIEALRDIRAAENLATYSAAPEFKAIPFSQLSPQIKGVINANAAATGMSPEEYYKSRGGVNQSGYYGDSYNPGLTLSEREYQIARLEGGPGTTGAGAAINLASAKKAYDFYIAQGDNPVKASIRSGFTGTPFQVKAGIGRDGGNIYLFNGKYYDDAGNEISESVGKSTWNNSSVVATSANVGSTQATFAPTSFLASNLATPQATAAAAEEKRRAGQSAYNLLLEQFNQYGLGALVAPLQALIVDGLSPAEFTLRLRDTDAYKKRFAANQSRIQRGLRALSEAEYIGLEDQYQNVMRNYGLPANYYTRGDMGRQEGFEKFIAGDVSAAELEDRIQTAQNRVINAAPEVSRALREFYPGITNGDILAYTLDPDKALTDIRRKVTAAEIGAGAMQAGLATGVARAEELGRFGVTGEQARQGFATIAEFLPSAQKLSDIYRKQGLGEFTQATAEQEVFGIAGAAEAGRKRRKLTELEQAAFSGSAGTTGGALARDRAGSI